MAISIYLENGKVVVKSLATVNAAYDPAYFSPIQAKQYPTEGFLTATRVGTTNNLSITDANGKYIVYDLPYTEYKQKNGTTNIGSTVLSTVSTLNGTSYFGFDVDFNSSISSIDTRVGGTETTLTDVGKALRYDKNNGADPRGIYYDDQKSESDSFVTVESAKATIQGGLTTNLTVEELNGISYFKFNALDTAGSYSMLTVIGKNQAGTLNLNNGTLLRFDNGTNNASIGISSLTANRNLVLPDASGTIALTSDITTSLNYVDFDIVNPPSLSDGRLAYDVDRETLVFQSEHGELAIGEGYKPVYNNTGSNIPAGTVVQAIGVNGEKFLIEPFDASAGVSEELYFIGVTQKQINNATAGIVVSEGYVKHLDTSGYTLETILYASETPGELTATKPSSPNLGVVVAMVTKVDGTNGTIYVRPTAYAHLGEMHDVSLPSPSNNDLLKYNTATGVWTHGTVNTDEVTEGSNNLYWTQDRFNTAFAGGVSGITSDDIADGTTTVIMTAGERTKLTGIEAGAEVNVQSDWNATSGDAFIANKPTIPTDFSELGGSTDDVPEGQTNKYYTDAKVDARISALVNETAPVVITGSGIMLEDDTYDNSFILINSATSVDVEMEGHTIYNGWEAGTEFYFMQGGAGEINLVPLGPQFYYPSDKSLMTRTQNSVIGMKCLVAPTPTTPGYWVVFGDLKDA